MRLAFAGRTIIGCASVSMRTLYDVLGVRPDADDESIRTAFREAAKAHHPDLNRDDPNAALRFRQIVQASAVLRDARQREDYDRELQVQRRRLWSEWTHITIKCSIAAAVISTGIVGASTLFTPGPATTIAARNAAVPNKAQDNAEAAASVMSAVRPAAEDDAKTRDISLDDYYDAQAASTVTDPRDAVPAAEHGVPAAENRIPAPESGIRAEPAASLASPAGAASGDPASFRELAIVACRNGDVDRAIAALDQAIRLDPNDAQAHDIRGNIRDDLGAADRALADYDRAIGINPNNPEAFHDRGISWQRKGVLDKALVDLDRAIRFTFSDANMYSDRGLVWYEKGRHDRAMADFSRAIKIDRTFAAAYIRRGLTLHRNGECNRMRAGVDRAIRIDTDVFEAVSQASPPP
jgi:curved DNA-binding protein CbpA